MVERRENSELPDEADEEGEVDLDRIEIDFCERLEWAQEADDEGDG